MTGSVWHQNAWCKTGMDSNSWRIAFVLWAVIYASTASGTTEPKSFAVSLENSAVTPKTPLMKNPKNRSCVRKSVFIVDDHPIYRDGLTYLIQTTLPNVDVCGQADDAVTALEKILKTNCDVVIVDVALPGRSGLELARDIHTMRPKTAVLIISAHNELMYAERALRNHARGYVMKHEPPARVVSALKAVLAGEVWFSERVSAKLFDLITGRESISTSCCSVERLTDRELEILKLIGEGRRNKEIAGLLNLSPKTVDVHRCHIREKLGLSSGPELVCYAAHWVTSLTVANHA
jgi:DNA-binding NarL/FixJ family response regulator